MQNSVLSRLLGHGSHPVVLLAPGTEMMVQEALGHLSQHEHFAAMTDRSSTLFSAQDDFWPSEDDWRAAYRPYKVKGGVLMIPVMGVLLHKFGYQVGQWATGYEYIRQAMIRGNADPEVAQIALMVHSPGGAVAGCFELAEEIAQSDKRVTALVDDYAYSAAYALASSTSRIVVSASGGTGSVGVVATHIDYSEALKADGIKVTFIFAGKHKVDGNPYEKLPDAVKARIQERVDQLYAVFVAHVASARGLTEVEVRDTEALVYDADESVEIGFADAVVKMEDELAAMRAVGTMENGTMSGSNNTPAITQEQMDSAVATARSEGFAAGATAERARIQTVLQSDEAKERPASASKLVFNEKLAGLSAADLTAMLGDLPKEKAETQTAPAQNALADAMAQTGGGPAVGTQEPAATGEADKPEDMAATIMADYRKASGRTAAKR